MLYTHVFSCVQVPCGCHAFSLEDFYQFLLGIDFPRPSDLIHQVSEREKGGREGGREDGGRREGVKERRG